MCSDSLDWHVASTQTMEESSLQSVRVVANSGTPAVPRRDMFTGAATAGGEIVDERTVRDTLGALRTVLSEEQLAGSLKVSVDRLRRPKLNFLFRIFSEVSRTTGFCSGIFADPDGQLAVKSVGGKDVGSPLPVDVDKQLVRSGKLEYFNRIQIAVSKALEETHLTASTRNLITGKDSVGANFLLQVCARARSVLHIPALLNGRRPCLQKYCRSARAHLDGSPSTAQARSLFAAPLATPAAPASPVAVAITAMSAAAVGTSFASAASGQHCSQQRLDDPNRSSTAVPSSADVRFRLTQPELAWPGPTTAAEARAVESDAHAAAVVVAETAPLVATSRSVQEKLGRVRRKLEAVVAVEPLLSSVREHARVLQQQTGGSGGSGLPSKLQSAAFDALLATVIGPHAERLDDLHAKTLAAEALHLYACLLSHASALHCPDSINGCCVHSLPEPRHISPTFWDQLCCLNATDWSAMLCRHMPPAPGMLIGFQTKECC